MNATRLVMVLLLGVSFPAVAASPVSPEEVRQVLDRTEAALKGVPAGSDVIFTLAQAGRLIGRRFEPPLRPEIEQGRSTDPLAQLQYQLWLMRHAEMPRAPQVLYGPERSAAPAEPQQNVVAAVIRVMANGLTCKSPGGVQTLVGEAGAGYVATHQLLALMLATSRGCLARQQFERNVHPYVRRINAEMLRDLAQFTDLQVERVAFLVLAGRADLVPEGYLKGLLKMQSPDGLWHLGSPADHTSALAYLALSSLLQPKDPLAGTYIMRGENPEQSK